MQKIVWELETEKIKKALQKGIRADGRSFDEYRPIELSTNISHNADGSCRIKLGKTDVMVGIKCTIGEPYPDNPNEGSISVNAEFMPIACDEFETGPPSEDSIETSRVVDRGIRESKAIDFAKLLIKEGEKVWVLWADIYPVNFDGNLFDSSSIACLKAFEEAKLPKLNEKLEIIPYEFGEKIALDHQPLLCTFVKVDHSVLLDPTRFEEKAAKARFSVAVTEEEKLTAFQKGGGSGSFSVSEISHCIEIAIKKTKEIRKKFF